MPDVRWSEEFGEWYEALGEREQRSVVHVVALLESLGIALGDPHASAIRGATFPLRELRPRRGRSPLRILYAFDPRRDAVVLLGGNKARDARFYERAVRQAEIIWARHLEWLQREGDR